jgi:hypothetical protein
MNTMNTPTVCKGFTCQTQLEMIQHLSEKLDHEFKRIDDQLAQMDRRMSDGLKRVDDHLSQRESRKRDIFGFKYRKDGETGYWGTNIVAFLCGVS